MSPRGGAKSSAAQHLRRLRRMGNADRAPQLAARCAGRGPCARATWPRAKRRRSEAETTKRSNRHASAAYADPQSRAAAVGGRSGCGLLASLLSGRLRGDAAAVGGCESHIDVLVVSRRQQCLVGVHEQDGLAEAVGAGDRQLVVAVAPVPWGPISRIGRPREEVVWDGRGIRRSSVGERSIWSRRERLGIRQRRAQASQASSSAIAASGRARGRRAAAALSRGRRGRGGG